MPRSLDAPPGLVEIEAAFVSMRRERPAAQIAFDAALACVTTRSVTGMLDVARRTGLAVLDAADQLAQRDAEPAYHNRRHVAETMLAMGWLCALARADGSITQDEAVLGVVAMAGHDFGHDGTRSDDGSLEAKAAAATCTIASSVGLGAPACATLERLILATIPDGSPQSADCAEAHDPLVRLVREADVLASLLPRLGWQLGVLLRREWRRAGEPDADDVASFAGRHAFLSSRGQHSPAATRLGLAALTSRQCVAFEVFAEGLGGAAGAAALDRMNRAEALRQYRVALTETATGGGPSARSARRLLPIPAAVDIASTA